MRRGATASCLATTKTPRPPRRPSIPTAGCIRAICALRLPNGYYRITGRIKDMVIRGGENIYPREIEEFLFTHPSIEQAAVVGVPDKKYVEELCAWIKLKVGCLCSEDEIRDFCRGRLAHYKVPRYVKFVESFPQTVTGKIQKFKIREIMIEEYGLCEQETA